ncbi:MAG TPA: VOC family protein [Planctomycetota bacterium]|nr:VOC family protein [Planctomycetota bacterium]
MSAARSGKARTRIGAGQKITPFLWFDGQAEEAARFYVSLFPGKGSKIEDVSHYPDGSAMAVSFRVAGQRFVALNGGPEYEHTPAMSLYIDCATQAEVDALWKKLCAGGGEPLMCGWVTDRFGVTWQVVPSGLPELLDSGGDPERAARVMKAMMKMKKLDMPKLEKAAAGRA